MKARALSGTEPSTTSFLNTLAVETWDTWFRWRADGQLRDVTIEDTWQRVASALAAGPARPPGYKHRLVDAFTAWHLLLDERVLASAGTTTPQWSANNLCAVLNAATFVRAPGLRHATFDHVHFEEVAALAVHALDDAAVLADEETWPMPHVRVGIIGLSDALALLDLGYDNDSGRKVAGEIARTLAQGCLAGSIALARDRGARARCDDDWCARAEQRGFRRELIDAALRHGLRQYQLTAITSQPRLAAFANGVADALDPLPDASCSQTDSYAATVNRRTRGAAPLQLLPMRTCVAAQLQLRAAMQPWIDERIVYPLSINRAPESAEINAWNALAHQLNLAPLSWRFVVCGAHGVTPLPDSCASAG